MDWHRPFFSCFIYGKLYRFENSLIRRKWHLVFDVFSNFVIEIFNQIGGVYDFTDFDGEFKKYGRTLPIVSPWLNSVQIFAFSFACIIFQSCLCRSLVWSRLKCFLLAVNAFLFFQIVYLLAISEFMNYTCLFLWCGENRANGLCNFLKKHVRSSALLKNL